jgi:hypothetical protein
MVRRAKRVNQHKYMKPILDVSQKHLQDEDSFTPSDEHRERLERVRHALHWSCNSFFLLETVFVDMIVCYRMAGRYPWSPKYIRRSEHMHFVWVSFVNLCYIFEERMKSAVNMYNAVSPLTQKEVDPSKYLKLIKRDLGPSIRARGLHVHQNHPGSEDIILYRAVEFVQQIGDPPTEMPMVEHGVKLTRKRLREQIGQDVAKTEDILNSFFEETGANLVQAVVRFAEYKEAVKARSVSKE